MLEVKRKASRTLTKTISGSPTNVKVTIYHDWGDLVLAETAATTVSANSFKYVLTSTDTASAGVHKVVWSYTEGTAKSITDYFLVYDPYVEPNEFFSEYPELESSFSDKFVPVEKKIRKIVDTYCGQSFEFISGKTLKLDGSGGNYLHTVYRIDSLTSVKKVSSDEDITAYVEISPESDYYIRRNRTYPNTKEYLEPEFGDDRPGRFFRRKQTYAIKGDFGWSYVPFNVEEATKILIADFWNQDSDYRRHNVIFQGIGPVQTNFRGDLMGTTGNLDADVLLMDYTRFVLDHI